MKVKSLGCYQRNVYKDDLYFNARGYIDWTAICSLKTNTCNFTSIIQKCARHALLKGYDFFAVQYFGECWADKNPNKYKTATTSKSCFAHVGSGSSSEVYKIYKPCSGGHSHGSHYNVPQTYEKCLSCNCQDGHSSCVTMRCDYPFPCEKHSPAPKGQCCGKCACHHKGVDKMNGEEWDDRRTPGVCRQCQCVNGEARCMVKKCPANCHKPERIPGRCCPRCTPKAPTTRPWETIPPTRGRPTFPPWLKPPFGKRKKRSVWKLTRQ